MSETENKESTEETEGAQRAFIQITATKQMTEYQSHKRVNAEKILKIILESEFDDEGVEDRPVVGGARIMFDNYTFINVEPAFLKKHEPKVGGYIVIYGGGYTSWSPADAFEGGNIKVEDIPKPEEVERINLSKTTFDNVLAPLKDGHRIAKGSWPKGTFVFRQVPASIDPEIVPKMQSLPDRVKEEFHKRTLLDPPIQGLNYSNQLAMCTPDNMIVSYNPTTIDILAEDWMLLD